MHISDCSSVWCSSDLLIMWQWLPSKSVQERFDQQVAVGSVPKIVHLTAGAQIRKPPQYMQRNRDSDLAYCIGLFTVLDIGLDEFRCSHKTHRQEEHTSELQSQKHITYAVFCLKKKTKQ